MFVSDVSKSMLTSDVTSRISKRIIKMGDDMENINAGVSANGWDRDQVTIRLVKVRRARLKELSKGLDDGLSPTDVIDWALTEAARDRSQPLEVTYALDDLTEAMGKMERLLAIDLDKLNTLIESNVAAMDDLAKAFKDAAGADGEDEVDDVGQSHATGQIRVPSVGDWLAKEFASASSKIVAIASWQFKERASQSAVTLSFTLDVLSVDGAPVNIGKSMGHAARFEFVENASPFAKLDQFSRVLFSFEKNGAGAWNVMAYRCEKDGRAAGVIGMRRV